jgi:hypothetical protein
VRTCSPHFHLDPHAGHDLLVEIQDQALEHVQVTANIKVALGWAQFKDDSQLVPMSRHDSDHVTRGIMYYCSSTETNTKEAE